MPPRLIHGVFLLGGIPPPPFYIFRFSKLKLGVLPLLVLTRAALGLASLRSFYQGGYTSPAPWVLPLLVLTRAALGLASLRSDWIFFEVVCEWGRKSFSPPIYQSMITFLIWRAAKPSLVTLIRPAVWKSWMSF